MFYVVQMADRLKVTVKNGSMTQAYKLFQKIYH